MVAEVEEAREGAVGITFANIATNSRFAIGCICGSVARSHVKSTPPPPASRVCVASATKTRQTWRPVHYRLPVTHKIPQLKSVSKYAGGTAADAADAGRGVIHSTISLSATALFVHTPSAFPFQRDRPHTTCLFFRFLSPCIPMTSTFWSDACTYARNKPLPTRLDALYASCGATVRRPTPSLVSLWHAYSFVAGRFISV